MDAAGRERRPCDRLTAGRPAPGRSPPQEARKESDKPVDKAAARSVMKTSGTGTAHGSTTPYRPWRRNPSPRPAPRPVAPHPSSRGGHRTARDVVEGAPTVNTAGHPPATSKEFAL
nr:hypothetical protein [Streptomyces sp.]